MTRSLSTTLAWHRWLPNGTLRAGVASRDRGFRPGRERQALFDSWEELSPTTVDEGGDAAGRDSGSGQASMSAFEATGKMPYDFSPARLRCMELADELADRESLAS